MAASLPTLTRWLTGPRIAAGSLLRIHAAEDRPTERRLRSCTRRLEPLRPRFVPVTYGARGRTQARTHATVTRIVPETGLIPVVHLTCVGAGRADMEGIARSDRQAGCDALSYVAAMQWREEMHRQARPVRRTRRDIPFAVDLAAA